MGKTKQEKSALKYQNEPMTLPRVLKYAGDMGRYQILVFFLVGLVNLGGGMTMYSVNYLSPVQDHWCAKPAYLDWTDEQWKTLAIPKEGAIADDRHCKMYQWNWNDTITPTEDQKKLVPCGMNGYTYDKSVRETTAVSEWNLVCEKESIFEFVSPLFSVGMLVGAMTGGMISDRFGRKTSLMVFCFIQVAFGLVTYFSIHEWMYIIGRAFTGAFVRGVGPAGAIILVELFSTHRREAALVGYNLMYAFAIMTVTLIAYFIRDFRTLKLLITAPYALTVFYLCLLYESPSWLINCGRIDDAVNIVKKIAKTNKREISEKVIEEFRETSQKAFDGRSSKKSGSLKDLVQNPTIRKYTIICSYQWTSVLLTITSVLFNISGLFGDVYMNMLVSALIDVPAAAVNIFGLKFIGRRVTLMFWQFAICAFAIAGIVITFIDTDDQYAYIYGGLMLSIRVASSLNLGTLQLYTPEVFPVSIRQLALGTTTMCGCAASILGPYLGGKVVQYWAPSLSVILAVVAFFAGCSMAYMPETLGKKLPFSMQDAIDLDDKSPKNPVPTVNGDAGINMSPKHNDAYRDDEGYYVSRM